MKKVLIIISALLFNLSAVAGPFGLELGMKASDFSEGDIEHISGMLYDITPPNPNSYFNDYSALILPVAGLCRVIALTDIMSRFNSTSDFKQVEDLLTEKYKKGEIDGGNPERENSSFNRLKQKYWPADGNFDMPDNLGSIVLSLYEAKSDKGKTYVEIHYEFANIHICIREKIDKEKSSL